MRVWNHTLHALGESFEKILAMLGLTRTTQFQNPVITVNMEQIFTAENAENAELLTGLF